jgi:DNA-binding CsgD family transcriptional regulator
MKIQSEIEQFSFCCPLLSGINLASNLDDLVTAFDSQVKALGMNKFCLFEIASIGICWRKQLVIGTFPDEFLDRFWHERRTFDSPYIRHAQLYGRPFTASEVKTRPNLSRRERQSIQLTTKSGFPDGIFFPQKTRFHRIAFIVITGDTRQLSKGQIYSLSCVCLRFYQRACTLDPNGQDEAAGLDTGALTERERECLTWVALGNIDKQIAKRLGITERTVKYHINNAKKKLGVTTRLQGVITAMRNVEIII